MENIKRHPHRTFISNDDFFTKNVQKHTKNKIKKLHVKTT